MYILISSIQTIDCIFLLKFSGAVANAFFAVFSVFVSFKEKGRLAARSFMRCLQIQPR